MPIICHYLPMPLSFQDRIGQLAGRCAVPGLIRYVALFNALVFILHLLAPGYDSILDLDPSLVMRGQVWRLVTWIFIPETLSPFWIFFALLFLLYLGDGLEAAIGPGKLTLFYLSGMAACTAVSFAFSLAGDGGSSLTRANTFLNLSLLLAFATVYPDFKVLVFFVLPMRIAWLALISAALMILSSIGQPPVVAATLGAAFLNYLLFFGSDLRGYLGILRPAAKLAPALRGNREPVAESLHRCEECGRTELSHPDLEFRVTASGHEYCREHLKRSNG
jgi:membrane associated rhomboid family serine protease